MSSLQKIRQTSIAFDRDNPTLTDDQVQLLNDKQNLTYEDGRTILNSFEQFTLEKRKQAITAIVKHYENKNQ